jgi:hypothetical protein
MSTAGSTSASRVCAAARGVPRRVPPLLPPRALLTRARAVQVFYRSNPAREAFVEMCESDYVQKMTFDSYLYKTVVPGNPLDDVRLLVQTVGSLLRGNALRQGAKSVSFGSRAAAEEKVAA